MSARTLPRSPVLPAARIGGLLLVLSLCGASACGGHEAYDLSGDYDYLIAQGDMPLACQPAGESTGVIEVYTGAGDSLHGTFAMCNGGFTGGIGEGHLRGDAFSLYMGGFIVRGTVAPGALIGLADGFGFTGLTFRATRVGLNHGKVLP